jgi:hypothetical protein
VNQTRPHLFAFASLSLAALSCSAGPFSLVSGSEQVTAVSSKVFNGYSRTRLPDGSLRAETYAFGDGGLVSAFTIDADTAGIGANGGAAGGVLNDETMDKLTFDDIAKTISGSLAAQGYVPTPNPDSTNLLIMVYWGMTVGSTDTHTLEGGPKDYVDLKNAQLLGFDSEHVFDQGFDDHANMMANILRELHSDVVNEIQRDRYFVVLRAFDFRSAWKQKKIRLLWETRFSMSEREHDFTRELPGMAEYASRFFGQDTHGLRRSPVPEGRVDIGDVKSLGPVPEK